MGLKCRVHKFGGASVRHAEAIRQVAGIMQQTAGKEKGQVLVISAMAKTTNALEEVTRRFFKGEEHQMQDIRTWHLAVVEELFAEKASEKKALLEHLNDLFVEAEWILEEEPPEDFNFLYDQLVSLGELLSTRIVAAWLQSEGLPVVWKDARDFIRTDESFREGRILWPQTTEAVRRELLPEIEKGLWPLTQGFIGSTDDNYTTTLGREGSDYTAAILGHCLDAEGVTIWKDVPGVLTADPRIFENPLRLDKLSYREAIEMTYYGAQVLHPKTIKPLQNKNIPLEVRSFLQPTQTGSLITAEAEEVYPPIISIERQQALLQISTRDFSFVAEHHISYLFDRIARQRLRVNLMQNSAISFSLCLTDVNGKTDRFIEEIKDLFNVQIQRDLELINLRHARPETKEELLKNRLVLLEQRLGNTVQMVVRKLPPVKYREWRMENGKWKMEN